MFLLLRLLDVGLPLGDLHPAVVVANDIRVVDLCEVLRFSNDLVVLRLQLVLCFVDLQADLLHRVLLVVDVVHNSIDSREPSFPNLR